MSFTNLMGLLGGLALFLYGMQMMSTGLEKAAGNKMKVIMEKLTANRFIGVLAGALITAVIQSSSATTVMVVGFVNSGMMTLGQAVWIIMGANIGTTITGQLIALDVGAFAPLMAFLGVAAIVFSKNEKMKHIGEVLAGLGILFIGMDMMSSSMQPLANSKEFVNILTKFENPILGILAGTIFTALIQSSSASVGILQALAKSGIIGLHSAAFVLFGQNIGTCVTALLASIGTNRNARRTTLIHVMFNVIGTILFTTLCLLTPLTWMVQGWTPDNPSAQIANLHTMFNIVTTILLIPFGTMLPKVAKLILPDKAGEEKQEEKTLYLLDMKHVNTEKHGSTVIYIEGIKKELSRMMEMARDNVQEAFDTIVKGERRKYEQIAKREDYIDYLNKEISKYITNVIAHENTKMGSQILNSEFTIASNLERISDHAMNIAEYCDMIEEKHIVFPEYANIELKQMQDVCQSMFVLLQDNPTDWIEWHEKVSCMEQKIDDMTIEYRNNMYQRIKEGICTDEGSILFAEILVDFERIGDHGLNISNEMLKIVMTDH